MANWSARITNKSEVTSDGLITYEFVPLLDGVEVNGTLTVTGEPSEVQQLISAKITVFAQAYEIADSLPVVGDVLSIITTD